jgi:cyanophycinase
MNGSLALVGSGEYLPAMAQFENSLVADGVTNGKEARFLQIPTAAGRESSDRLEYWKELGIRQAKNIGVEATYLPIFTREDGTVGMVVW